MLGPKFAGYEKDGYRCMNKRQVGSEYENMAAEYLVQQGYEILEMNYRCRIGEIDIIAKQGMYLVFVEVKFRTDNTCGDPLEAVDWRKQRQICRVALYYYTKHGYRENIPCRFDVIAVYGDETIKQIENAFEYRK